MFYSMKMEKSKKPDLSGIFFSQNGHKKYSAWIFGDTLFAYEGQF